MLENLNEIKLPEANENLNEVDESVALELSTEALENVEEGNDGAEGGALDSPEQQDAMEGMLDSLQLTDAEKAAFREIGKDLTDLPMENGYVSSYKKGSCYDRLIPVYS